MATLEKAIEIAARAHAGQHDKQGMPYILHPLRLMMNVEGLEAKMVAVLHDVLEDTAVTEADLRREGFSETVLAGVLAVTRRADENYTEFVIRAARLEIARQVKLADLADNASLARLLLTPHKVEHDMARLRKYFLSYKFLTGQHSEQEYRTLMNGA